MELAILILLTIAVLLLIIIAVKVFSMKGGTSAVTDEKIENLRTLTQENFASLRRDTAASNESMRTAVSEQLTNVANKMEIIAQKIADGQLSTIIALGEMREKLDSAGKQQTNAVTEAVEKLQQSNEQKLEQMRLTVDEKLTQTLTTRLDSSFKSVSEQLSNVYKSLGEMRELSSGVTALNRVFSNVKTRGNWAECQLEGILDRIIPGMYVKNYRSDESRDMVEFAVMIPDSDSDRITYLPIDSKFPMEDYLRLCDAADAGDTEGVRLARKALEARVLAEAKDISKYINVPFTTPFAVLYLATDSLYAEVLASKENLADRLHNDYHIMIAGPSTITALLSSLALGFRTVALNRKAGEVMDLLAAAKTQYDKFGIALERAKRKIDEASSSIDDAQKRNSIIVKKLKGVELISGESSEMMLGTDE